MKSLVVAWLERNGLPGWLAPDYMMMVGIAGLLGAAVTMWLSERDGANTRIERRALIATYVGALLGGYVFEWLRVLPEAIVTQSREPLLHVGRAAYGGFLGGTLCAAVVLWRGGVKVRPFLDRAVPLTGISYGLVRVGCFLAGCDYGKPTASALGVRFPAGSPAAMDHANLGWVARGGESLPVHATQLYEAAVGVIAALAGSMWLVKGKRDGRAFATFVVVYAVGRFFVEMLRGDGSRGTYGAVSTAQWVSIALVVAVGALVWHAKREMRKTLVVAAALATFLILPQGAMAQPKTGSGASSAQSIPPPPPVPSAQPYPAQTGAQPYPYPPPGAQPYPYPYPYPPPPAGAQPYPYPPPPASTAPPAATPPPPEEPKVDHQKDLNTRNFGIGLAFGLYNAPKFGVSSGGMIELETVWRFPTSAKSRVELGLEGRLVLTGDATQGGVGTPVRFVGGVGKRTELEVAIVPFYSRTTFDSPYFEGVNAFGARLQFGVGWALSSHVQLGLSPIVVGIMGSPDVNAIYTFEPKMWIRIAPF